MLDTSARLLALLSLLQGRRDWSGAELAERLGVGPRTVRRDIERLRRLGYPVHGARGVAGGYRLGAGAALPPLLLDDEEAVAVAVGLRTTASVGVAGIEETSVRALAKLEQVLPSRLRRRVAAVGSATVAFPGTGPAVDAETLALIAAAARDRYQARVVLNAPLERAAGRVPPTVGTLEPIDDAHCLLRTGSDWLGGLAVYIADIGVDFEVLEPPELVAMLRELSERFSRAVGPR